MGATLPLIFFPTSTVKMAQTCSAVNVIEAMFNINGKRNFFDSVVPVTTHQHHQISKEETPKQQKKQEEPKEESSSEEESEMEEDVKDKETETKARIRNGQNSLAEDDKNATTDETKKDNSTPI